MVRPTDSRWLGRWRLMPPTPPLPMPPTDGLAPLQRRSIARPVPPIAPAVPPRRPSTRWCSITSRPFSPRRRIPHLPTRQWVLSVPKRLRPFLHQTPEVASGVLGLFLRAPWETFSRGSAIRRAGRAGFARNVCVALGNWGSAEAVPVLTRALEDREPLVRGHAAWALGRVGGAAAKERLSEGARSEEDAWVSAEFEDATSKAG